MKPRKKSSSLSPARSRSSSSSQIAVRTHFAAAPVRCPESAADFLIVSVGGGKVAAGSYEYNEEFMYLQYAGE